MTMQSAVPPETGTFSIDIGFELQKNAYRPKSAIIKLEKSVFTKK